MQAAFKPLVTALTDALRSHFGGRLSGVAIYGSVARGTAVQRSDVDVLIVADELPKSPMARLREFDPVELSVTASREALVRTGFVAELAPLLWGRAQLEAFSFLHLDLATDAEIIFDPEGILARRFARVRQRMAELGTRRVPHRGTYYWLLKPEGLQPGEVIDI